MNPEILAAISNFKEKGSLENASVDLTEFERRQREIHNELIVKKEKVEQLQQDLDAANLKVHQLNLKVETMKHKLEEQEYNLNLAVQNNHQLEDKLKEKNECVIKARLQQNMTGSEKNTLQTLLEKAEMDKYELSRKLDELKSQHQYDEAFQKDLMNQDVKIRSSIAELKEIINKLQQEQNQVIEMSNTDKDQEQLLKTLQFYKDEILKLKKLNRELEEKFVYATATSETLEHLLQNYNQEKESSLTFKEWQKCSEYHRSQLKVKNEIIDKLTKNLKSEKEANKKLIVLDSENNLRIQDLKNKLQECVLKNTSEIEAQTSTGNNEIFIKNEVIEILD